MDLVLCNNHYLIRDYKILVNTFISDHYTICLSLSYLDKKDDSKTRTKTNISTTELPKYDYFQADEEDKVRIRTLLRKVDWKEKFCGLSLSEKLSVFYDIVQNNVEIIFPLRKEFVEETQNKETEHSSKNKIPRKVRTLMRNKKKLSTVLLVTKSASKYLKYQTELESIEKDLKKLYDDRRKKQEKEALHKIKTNPRVFYSYAKRFSKLNTGIGPFYDKNDELVNDDFKLAEILRNQYENVFSIPIEEMKVDENLFEENYDDLTSIPNVHFVKEDILDAIDHLSNYAAAGPDGFPAVLLKICKVELAEPLEMIFRESLDSGFIPDIWKKAFIFPIHKGGERTEPANYRPVSLTSHLMKTMERVVKRYLVANLEANNKLNDAQHGFRQRRSCLSQLLQHYDKVLGLLEEGDNVDVVYLDFAKAFDKVDHGLLLRKMKKMGITGKLGKWILNFLLKRKQQVIFGGKKSTESEVLSGVPQGSVLGPLLFLIMINDINHDVGSNVSLFADDTRISSKISSEECVETFQEDLEKLYEWQNANNMKFNGSKFELIRYGTKTDIKENTLYFTPEHEKIIEETDVIKDLGVNLTADMKFSKHVEKVIATRKWDGSSAHSEAGTSFS